MLHEGLLAHARQTPDAAALVVDGSTWSYQDLASASRALAARFCSLVGTPRVGLLASRSATAYVGYLATLRSGGTVVPLSAASPPSRLRRIADQARLTLVVADGDGDVPDLGVEVLRLSTDDCRALAAAGARMDPHARGDQPHPETIAYLLFTSGSTGQPKGVPIRHRNTAAWLAHVIDAFALAPGCRFAQVADLTFDAAVEEMFGAWGAGATLVVPTREDLFDPVEFVNLHGITHWSSVPSVVGLNREELRPGKLPTLQVTVFGGEALTIDQAATWSEAAPASRIINSYGPTETVVDITTYELAPDRSGWPVTSNGTVPIGSVFPHLQSRLDPATGELQVRGPQRFDGYVDPADNAGRFLEPGPDLVEVELIAGSLPSRNAWYRTGDHIGIEGGQLVHRGRIDDQVKLFGQRLEPSEVEHALCRWAGAHEAAVVLLSDPDPSRTRLGAVLTGPPLSAAEIRGLLLPHLPLAFIPKEYVHRAQLPINGNGKTDRAACVRLLHRH
jgi:amino acid adenylation domain-containing protein